MQPEEPPFSGVGVALVTLFDDTGAVDVGATADLAARLVDDGVRAVLVAGSTGEPDTLDDDERQRLLAAVRARVTGVPVLAGTGGAWAGQAVSRTLAARDGGADGAVVLSPRRADPEPYYRAVVDAAGGFRCLAYHYPTASQPGIPVELLPKLPVTACKDSSGSPDRLLQELSSWDGSVYVGSSSILSFAGPLGCAGAILALANAEPVLCAAAFAGDPAAQRALTPAHLVASASFPAGIKQLVADRYGTSPACRMG
jgi:dihydrodipicolinate synthase/N-acetylneuraminate lyase